MSVLDVVKHLGMACLHGRSRERAIPHQLPTLVSGENTV